MAEFNTVYIISARKVTDASKLHHTTSGVVVVVAYVWLTFIQSFRRQ